MEPGDLVTSAAPYEVRQSMTPEERLQEIFVLEAELVEWGNGRRSWTNVYASHLTPDQIALMDLTEVQKLQTTIRALVDVYHFTSALAKQDFVFRPVTGSSEPTPKRDQSAETAEKPSTSP